MMPARTVGPGPVAPLAAVAALLPVPPAVRQAALEAFDSRAAGTLVLDLIYDSLLDADPALALPGQRQLGFSAGPQGVRVDVAIEPSAAGRLMTLQLTPARRRTVQVRCSAGTTSYESNEEGLLTAPVPLGPMSVVLMGEVAAGGGFQTAWVRG